MYKVISILSCVIFLSMGQAHAVDSSYQQLFDKILKNIKSLTPENYVEKILPLKKQMSDLFEKKKGVCRGEFSVDIFLPANQKTLADVEQKSISSKSERNACLAELYSNILAYQRVLYQRRKLFFIYSHQIQLKKLEQDFANIKREIMQQIEQVKKGGPRR